VKAKLRILAARILSFLNMAVPKSAIAVVYGFPPDEGNAVEVLRALAQRYRGRTYWFDGPSGPLPFDLPDSIRAVSRLTPRGVLLYLRAELIFYTHGLYGPVVPARRQTIVNLWHGDGIKVKNVDALGARSIAPASFVVGGTRLLTARKALDFKMGERSTIVVGNPRIAQFSVEPSNEQLSRLGIDPHAPYVLWLPTFRAAKTVGATEGWVDSSQERSEELSRLANELVDVLRRWGVQLVVKPHPLDRESFGGTRAIRVSSADIRAAGISLYNLLGRSDGLVTDYSSVWTDYLTLDRAIGFLVPDKDQYREGRGLYPDDVLEWLPGIEIDSSETMEQFAQDVRQKGQITTALREAAVLRLGLVSDPSPADRLLEELLKRNAIAPYRFRSRLCATN